jgi:uncharacterized damage-inducible protein DinB
MLKHAIQAIAICLLLVAASTTLRAQQSSGFRADLVGNISYAQKEILDLEGAIPEAKFTWRPTKEVRSISEVYAHIAFGNYLFAQIAGLKLPEGIVISGPQDEGKWDKASTDKKVIYDQMVKSFDYIKGQIKEMPDANLENEVNFFGTKMSTRSLFMALLGHIHEHLGQSIAYARSVGVVPPWTAARMAPKKDKM